MRKITAILVLVISCVSYAAYHCICVYQVQCAKEQAVKKMLLRVPDNVLTRIEENKDLQWNDDNECWYENQLFDVVKRVSQNGKNYLMCIRDEDEAAVLKKMSALDRSGQPEKDGIKIKNSLADIFCSQFCRDDENFTASTGINYFYNYTSPLSELSRKIPIPPPKI